MSNYIPRHAKKEDIELPAETLSNNNETKSNDKKSKKKPLILISAALLVIASIILIPPIFSKNDGSKSLIGGDEEPKLAKMDKKTRKMWLDNKEINDDYVGNIIFDSGIINLPIVHAEDVYKEDGELYKFYDEYGNLVKNPDGYSGNDVYLYTSWITGEYDKACNDNTIYFDFRYYDESQISIIYGHHIARDYDPNGDKGFTPLDLLLKEENYLDNKHLKLVLDNEIREYEVALVYIANATSESETSIITNLDLSNDEITNLNSLAIYDTDIELSSNNNILILVTCIEHQPLLRQIVICRELNRTHYS